jgi:hypothetical protein
MTESTSKYFQPGEFAPLWSYWDWAITGANCVVYIALPFGVSPDRTNNTSTGKRQLANVPVIAVGYQIQQNKTPIYGYADKKPRAILSGQSIVSGQLIIAHREVGYLKKKLREAGETIPASAEKLDIKENLRLQYWNTRSWETSFQDPQRKTLTGTDAKYNLFYAHPNFDISIVYGIGDYVEGIGSGDKINLTKLVELQKVWYDEKSQDYNDIAPLYRPPKVAAGKQRETISSVQLTGMQKQIAADGEIIVEAYSFLAMDVLEQ